MTRNVAFSTTQHALDDGRLPVVLGITGHRTLANADRVLADLKTHIATLVAAWSHTPFVAISPLAEGADRLFARAALALGLPLYVVLPLPAMEYEQDFPSSVDEFRALCHRAECVFVAHFPGDVVATPGAAGIGVGTGSEQQRRDVAYARAGVYLAQRTHVLFALWDGKPMRGVGGTAQIIEYKRSGHLGTFNHANAVGTLGIVSRACRLLDEPEPGLIVRLPVRRGDDDPTSPSPKPSMESIGAWDTTMMFSRLDEFNRCVLALPTNDIPMPRATSDSPHRGAIDEVPASQCEYERLLKRSYAADRVAGLHMAHLRAWFAWLFMFAGLAVTADVLFEDHARPGQFAGLIDLSAYLVALAAVVVIVMRIKRKRRNMQANEYRAVAEGLRVQCAWYRAGVADIAARHYLRRHSGTLGWLSFALRGAVCSERERIQPHDIEFVETHWIEEQRRYLGEALQRRRRVADTFRRGTVTLFGAGLVTSLLTLCGLLLASDPALRSQFHALNFAPFLGLTIPLQAILLATSGLLTTYVEFAAYEDDIREYQHILANYQTCKRRLRELDLPNQQALLHEIGIEAIRENAEWTIVHEAHDAKIPL